MDLEMAVDEHAKKGSISKSVYTEYSSENGSQTPTKDLFEDNSKYLSSGK